MSLPPGTRLAGLHRELFHASVNSSRYSRVGETGACRKPPGVSRLNQASRSDTLLPSVVNVGSSVFGLTSHGARAPEFRSVPVGSVQPSTGSWSSEVTQQPTTVFFGVCCAPKSGVGFVGKYCHFGGNGIACVPVGVAVEDRLTLPK